MKGYVVCVYKNISNEEKLKEYAVKAKVAVEKYKGKFLIRGGKQNSNEGRRLLGQWLLNFHLMIKQILLPIKRISKAHTIFKGHVDRQFQIVEGT